MQPTRIRTLVVIAVVVGGLAYVVARLVYGDLPALPAYSPVTLVLVALVNGYLGLAVRDRGRAGRPVRIAPLIVARYAALAKASSALGAGFVGGYVGLLAYLVDGLDKPHLRADAKVAAAGSLAALLLVLAALRLEHACRIPPREDDDEIEA